MWRGSATSSINGAPDAPSDDTGVRRVSRIAVVLCNLGGPDGPQSVRPFLLNLFNDPAIIGAPQPIRYLLARALSGWRAAKARAIYAELGGGSPLLANTEAQARALERALGELGEVRVFVAMRYWRPMAPEVVPLVKRFEPDEVVLLPLYPQFSTTTSASSRRAWHAAATTAGLNVPTRLVCCYPSEPGFVSAMAELVGPAYARAAAHGRPRLLLSAHGLPRRVVAAGDPYQWQVEASAAALVETLGIDGLEWSVCYQSRVGPLAWLEPSCEAEIRRAGRDKVPVVLMPVAFVSEHSETLVELDITYRTLARDAGVPYYERVPTVATHPRFIGALAGLVQGALARGGAVCPGAGRRQCPAEHRRCAMAL